MGSKVKMTEDKKPNERKLEKKKQNQTGTCGTMTND